MAIYRGPGGTGDSAATPGSDASIASTAAANAAASASAAASSATSAATDASTAQNAANNAANSETAAATSAGNAATSASAASSSASAASASQTAAALSESNTATLYDNFDDRYLGVKSTSPATDNDGNTLQEGALYFNSTTHGMYVWNTTIWAPLANEISATNAATSAAAALVSQNAAATSATNAATSATNASNSATSAATQATNAATSASSASTSASNAASSASSASTSASTATTKASEAATSATNAASSATSASGSASTATTQAGIATTQATNAASSASSASTSATNAANSATSASGSASTATTQASNAASSASAAATSASNAATSASNAATSETNSTTSATLANDWATKTTGPVAGGEYSAKYNAQQASTYASNASTSASNASTSASNAATSASNAATSASNAASSAASAAASYDAFDDRYLGAKSSAPTLDNDGNALLTGAIYWNTSTSSLWIWDGSSWLPAAFSSAGNVTSFNTRTGAITLTSGDVTGALTYTPLAPSDIGSTVQGYDGDLQAIGALTGTTGLLKKTAANTWSLDTNTYLTSYTETDPIYTASSWYGTTNNSSNWNTAYGWGNHATAGYTPSTRTLTVNGTTYDLTADRTWSVGTVTSVAELSLGTTGTDLSSTVANGTTAAVITLNVPTASATNRGALSSADWTTFNSKQPAGTYLTSVAIASSNGFAGSSSGGATPTITLTTSITGVLKGNGTSISAATAGTDYGAPATASTWSAPQRGTVTTDNDLSFDMSVTNHFKCTPTGTGTLTFTNITSGQSGFVLLVNTGGYAISAAATTEVSSTTLTTISTAGTYLLSYFSDGTNVFVTNSGALA